MSTGKYQEQVGEGSPPLTSSTSNKRMSRRTLLQAGLGAAVVTAGAGTYLGLERGFAFAAMPVTPPPANPVVQWSNATLQAIVNTGTGPTISARALAMVHTAIYDAWTTYDKRAIPTQVNGISRQNDKQGVQAPQAISFAAYRVLQDLFPTQSSLFTTLMTTLGYDPTSASMNSLTPQGVGNVAAQAVLDYRHQDGANQLGDMGGAAPYADYTGYMPTLGNPDHWQPLQLPTGAEQKFLTPHWGMVKPFALQSASQFRPDGPFTYAQSAFYDQVNAVLKLSANLNDTSKVIAEYWSDGPHSVTPPGHWDILSQLVLAQKVTKTRKHTLSDSVLLFFMLTNAIFDASIAVWECKRFYDSCRPVSAVHMFYSGKQIVAWGGVGKGTQTFDGSLWQSYIKTPAFPEYVSGHSTFSAAGAYVLNHVTGSDTFGGAYIAQPHASTIEAGLTPANSVTLSWPTFSAAAIEAGMSRRYGGIHFQKADRDGRQLGLQVASWTRTKVLAYINGTQK